MYNIKPLITEKTVNQSTMGWFTIVVPTSYTKPKIKSVVKEVFNVDPLEIKTINEKQIIARKAKGFQKERGFKKAILKLSGKQSIPGFASFAEEIKKTKATESKAASKEEAGKQRKTKND